MESVSAEVELKSAKFRTSEIGSIRQIGDTSFRFDWFHPLLCWYKIYILERNKLFSSQLF